MQLQLQKRRSTKKSKRHETPQIEQEYFCDDIYQNLEYIHEEKNMLTQSNSSKFESFSFRNITQAKQALANGKCIQLNLDRNTKPLQLLAMVHSLGFNQEPELRKIFTNSSLMVKKVLDEYISLLRKNKKIDPTFEYLYHCKRVSALKCDTNDLSAKCRLNLNLNFDQMVENDPLFQTRFSNELATKVFHCNPEQIRLHDVRHGSIILIIAGITAITLAIAGLVCFSVKLGQKRIQYEIENEGTSASMSENELHHQSIIKEHNIQPLSKWKCMQCGFANNKMSYVFCGNCACDFKPALNNINNDSVMEDTKDDTCIDVYRSESSDPNFVPVQPRPPPTIWDRFKLGIAGFQKQIVHELDLNPNHNRFQANPLMNNNEPGSVSMINPAEDELLPKIESKSKDACSDIDCESHFMYDCNESLLLNINDIVWVKKKDHIYMACVICLSQKKVTVEYNEQQANEMKKTETFLLNDSCLYQSDPSSEQEIEGCVQFNQQSGGMIQVWKRGCQPYADV